MAALSYREALDWLVASGSRGVKAGLERTEALLAALGHPERGLRGVLVAGTNGKGSVCAMTESACRAAGLRSLLLTKPHLATYRERIALDGRPIDEDTFAALAERARAAVDAVEAAGAGAPTQFEILTGLGVLAAELLRPDVVICEVGLGGRLDSTNVLDLGVACITSIALDHRDYLGDTVEQIAREKAGIIKPGDVVVAGADGPALEVVRTRAAAVGARRVLCLGDEIRRSGESRGRRGVEIAVRVDGTAVEALVPLAGAYQIDNAALAVAACHALGEQGLPVGGDAIAAGIARTRWPARLQWIDGAPALLVDAAHNPAAIAAMAPAAREIAGERPLVLLAGCMADKDVDGILEAMRGLAATPVFTQAGTMRAVPAIELARRWGPGARAVGSLPDALGAARLLAGPTGVVVVCGSLYLAGDVLALVGEV